MYRPRRVLSSFRILLLVSTLTLLCRSYGFYDCLTYNHTWASGDRSHRLYCGGASQNGELYLFLYNEHRTSVEWSFLTDPCAGPTGLAHYWAPLDNGTSPPMRP